MRKLVVLSSMLGLYGLACLAPVPAAAREYPWCLQLGSRTVPSGTFAMPGSPGGSAGGDFGRVLHLATAGGGGRNCGFDSYEQCMRARVGVGGFCEPNLFYQPEPARRAPRDRQRGR